MPDSTHPGEVLAAPLRRHLLKRFPADRAYPRPALRAEGMPPPVAAFLGRTLDRWVEMERDRFREDWASTGWFDDDDADVQRTEQAFFDALGRSARVPADAWADTLGGAVDLVVRFLTVPARALTDAIFEGTADPLPADAIRARLPLFSAYLYLADVATAYLDRKRPETLDPSDLFALLDRIDRRFVSEFRCEDWLELLAPLFDLTRSVPSLDGIPTPLLARFFDAKGEDDIADLLGEHDAAVLDEAALREVLAPAFPEASATEAPDAKPDPIAPEPEAADLAADAAEPELAVTAPEPAVVEPEPRAPEAARHSASDSADVDVELAEADPTPDPVSPPAEDVASEPGTLKLLDLDAADLESDTSSDTSDDGESADDADGGRPLWQRFAERTSDGDSVNARFGAPEPDTEPDAEPTAPLWKRFFARPDAEPGAPAPGASTVATEETTPTPEHDAPEDPSSNRSTDSLDTLEQRVLGPMPPAQRKRFIKHLFNGDAGKYVTVLHGLDAADSWTEASRVIARDVFRPSRVNIYGEHAVAFTDAVEARFRT